MAQRFEIRVPKMGMDTLEVVVGKWLVNTGDQIEIGTPLVELESEKTTFVVDSEAAGRMLEITHDQGSTAEVGQVIGVVEG
jgi:pyruvate/2-oxoglutarate dehydrogenase complex dihydrolipoamide acyltransferase (E2) component